MATVMAPVFTALTCEFRHPADPSQRLILLPVVAGTWEDPLKAAISYSGGSHYVLYLPFLSVSSVTALCDRLLASTYPDWRTSYEVRYAISLMTGHPRALEHLLLAYPAQQPFSEWRHDDAFDWVKARLLEQYSSGFVVNVHVLASGFLCLPSEYYQPTFWETVRLHASSGYLVALTESPVRHKKVHALL